MSYLTEQIKDKKVLWKKHTLKRMLERNISRQAVFEALETVVIIEEHELKRPLPSFLILGYSNKRPLHVMMALGKSDLWIITVYEPTLNEWEEDFINRRKS